MNQDFRAPQAQYHRGGAKGFDLEDPPSPGTPTSPAHGATAAAGDPGQPAQRGCRTRSGLLLMWALVDRVAFTTLDEHGTVVSLETRLVYAKP